MLGWRAIPPFTGINNLDVFLAAGAYPKMVVIPFLQSTATG